MTSALFDRIQWRDPVSGGAMVPHVVARTPAGVPLYGALQVEGTTYGYPIVDSVVRATPELARRYARWLEPFGLVPPPSEDGAFQPEETVESFGFQWTWNSDMRSATDLRWRVAERFHIAPADFAGHWILDAGAGAGDQSRWLINEGASVVSVDLSAAIDVVARKLRMHENWVGVQGDITALPFAPQFDFVYCEGVIQHTRDSATTVAELLRVVKCGGRVLATHYSAATSLRGRLRIGLIGFLRRRLSGMDRYKLLFVTGALAALAYVPGLRYILRRSGAASYYDGMPGFKSTWTNTYDSYGSHEFQRLIRPETFWTYFDASNHAERVYSDGNGVVVARKR